jgi:hypothetical protein
LRKEPPSNYIIFRQKVKHVAPKSAELPFRRKTASYEKPNYIFSQDARGYAWRTPCNGSISAKLLHSRLKYFRNSLVTDIFHKESDVALGILHESCGVGNGNTVGRLVEKLQSAGSGQRIKLSLALKCELNGGKIIA